MKRKRKDTMISIRINKEKWLEYKPYIKYTYGSIGYFTLTAIAEKIDKDLENMKKLKEINSKIKNR